MSFGPFLTIWRRWCSYLWIILGLSIAAFVVADWLCDVILGHEVTCVRSVEADWSPYVMYKREDSIEQAYDTEQYACTRNNTPVVGLVRRYTRSALYALRPAAGRPDLDNLAGLGILYYRRTRAGRHVRIRRDVSLNGRAWIMIHNKLVFSARSLEYNRVPDYLDG